MTVAGTVTAVLLVHRMTVTPPDGAAAFSVTVQVFVPEPVKDAPLQDSALNPAVSGGVTR